jgi:serine/threonine-protein kinase
MAPEQIDGRAEARERTDVYGLGAVLYEMLTGRPPFQGANELDTLIQVQRCRVVRPRRRNPSVDRGLESICLRCLERGPRRRYPSARALADDLERWRGRRRPRAHSLPARTSRAVRRHPFRTALLLAALIAAGLPPIRHLTSPEWALRRALDCIARGQPVTLVADTGPPSFYKVVLPYGDEIIRRADDGAFVFGSDTIGLLELVPDPQHEHYVFSAEVRRENVKETGDVGIYLLHSSQNRFGDPGSTRSMTHWYCVVGFNDSPMSVRDSLSFRFEHHLQHSDQRSTQRLGQSFPCVMSPDKVWHKVVVEVSQADVRVEWDGQLSNLSWKKLNGAADDLFFEITRRHRPPFSLRSPLGLYTWRGSASFRKVILTPIPLALEE